MLKKVSKIGIWSLLYSQNQILGFSPICDPQRFFFKNRALSLLYPYGALTSCKQLEKTNERSLRYLKTNGPRTTDKGDYSKSNLSKYWIKSDYLLLHIQFTFVNLPRCSSTKAFSALSFHSIVRALSKCCLERS